MESSQAIDALAALSQQTRLEAFRLLIKAGSPRMQAGDIANALGVRQNTISANLNILLRSGLVRNEREGRAVRYYADFDGIRGLLGFLMEDCCGGRSDLCEPVLDAITYDC